MENSLEKVKELAKMFLRMPIHESELSPIVVISLIKYLAPILYEADRLQLYCFPLLKVQRL